jgi:hypothetical protein
MLVFEISSSKYDDSWGGETVYVIGTAVGW